MGLQERASDMYSVSGFAYSSLSYTTLRVPRNHRFLKHITYRSS
jgi:hypothetical protein